jgi:LSD1 subclass zinc finger protein
VPTSINCHACGTLIDLTDQNGFTQIECSHCGAVSIVPLLFGNFLLLNPLGVGAIGTVYKATDLALNRSLAVKILRKKFAKNPDFVERFSLEARTAAAVNHPNVAQVYSFGEHQGHYYLAMELLERGSLDDRITQLGKLPEMDVLGIGAQTAAALRAAQQRGLIHRDIKPGNILFNDDGVPKIVDFGLARAQTPIQQSDVAPGPIWGTPYYVAPEKIRGQSEDFRSDIYSLGATLFHALAGRPPLETGAAGDVRIPLADALRTYAPITHEFTARLIGRMLANQPAERYDSYDELIHDLHEAQSAIKSTDSARVVDAKSDKRVSLVLVAIVVVAIIALIATLRLL